MIANTIRNKQNIASYLSIAAISLYWLVFGVLVLLKISTDIFMQVESNTIVMAVCLLLALTIVHLIIIFAFKSIKYTVDEQLKDRRKEVIFLSVVIIMIGGPLGIVAGIISLTSLPLFKDIFK